jgi:Mid2 like cell wall stress sensor
MSSTTLIATTFTAGLQNEFATTGLSNQSKNIVIGVVVGIGGAAILALVAVIIWRHMRKENEAKENAANLTYFSDEGPGEGLQHATANKETDFRSPALNAASNF